VENIGRARRTVPHAKWIVLGSMNVRATDSMGSRDEVA
jgi:hypothetical protein